MQMEMGKQEEVCGPYIYIYMCVCVRVCVCPCLRVYVVLNLS